MPVAERKQLRKISVFVVGVVLGFGTTSFLVLQPPQIIAEDSQWIRPAKPGDPLLWGRKGGIIFGLPSEGGLPGPRGLIRLGVISDKTGLPELLNFIAIEPAVAGRRSRGDRMAFSELEPSRMDPGLQGKRLWVGPRRFQCSTERHFIRNVIRNVIHIAGPTEIDRETDRTHRGRALPGKRGARVFAGINR
jgi:hypothetical protein